MRKVAGRLRTKMEVKIENGRAPFVCGVLAGERRYYGGGGDRFEEFTTVHHKSFPRSTSRRHRRLPNHLRARSRANCSRYVFSSCSTDALKPSGSTKRSGLKASPGLYFSCSLNCDACEASQMSICMSFCALNVRA